MGLKWFGERRHRQRRLTVYGQNLEIGEERVRETEEGLADWASERRKTDRFVKVELFRSRERDRELLAHDRSLAESGLCQVSQSGCRYDIQDREEKLHARWCSAWHRSVRAQKRVEFNLFLQLTATDLPVLCNRWRY